MARTFIGQLILRLQAQGLGEADKVRQAMDGITRQAKSLAAAPWGAGFQSQLNKLGASAREIEAVRQSWHRLHADMAKDNLSDTLKKSHISAWRIATLGHLTAVRAGFDETEKRARAFSKGMRTVMKPLLVAGGAYTLSYGLGIAGRAALGAASEQARTRYRMDLANIPGGEKAQMEAEAARLSAKYGAIDQAEILELNRATWALFGGNTDRAVGLMEPIIKAFIADVTAVGVEKAGENLSSFLKAADNLNLNEGPDGGTESIAAILEGWIKAKQVEGKEIDVGDLLGFARHAKVAKYALSDEFLRDILPSLGQDMGFEALGDALSGAYQNFVTPSAGGSQGQYVKRQQAAGLRDENNSLIERDLFASNPYQWATTVLKPLLEKNGVDTANTAALSEAVKKLMSNSKAAAAIVGWIEAQAQIDKNVSLYKGAAGTSDVDNARYKDPFAAWEAVQASLRNLSAETLPMEQIAAGLNGLADAINAFKNRVADGDPLVGRVALGAGAAAGAWTVWKIGGMVWGLSTAGVRLNTAATALQAAAVSLGGAGAADAAGDLGGKRKKPGLGMPGLLGIFSALGIAWEVSALNSDEEWNARLKANGERDAALDDWLERTIGSPKSWLDAIRAGDPAVWNHPPVVGTTEPVVGTRRISNPDGQGAVGAGKPVIDLSGIFDFFSRQVGDIGGFEGRDTLEGNDRSRSGDPMAGLHDLVARLEAIGGRSAGVAPATQQSSPHPDFGQPRPAIDDGGIAKAEQRVRQAAADMLDTLSIVARPTIDTSSVDTLIAKGQRALAILQQLGSAASAAESGVDRQLRRSMADYGVSP